MSDYPRLPNSSYRFSDGTATDSVSDKFELPTLSSATPLNTLLKAAFAITLATHSAEDDFSFAFRDADGRDAMVDGALGATLKDLQQAVAETKDGELNEKTRAMLEYCAEATLDNEGPSRQAVPFHLAVAGVEAELALRLTFDPKVSPKLEATWFLSHFTAALSSLVKLPSSSPPSELQATLASTEESTELKKLETSTLEADQTAYQGCETLHAIILLAAEQNPDAIAVAYDDEVSLTFSQLVHLSTLFAHHLLSVMPSPTPGQIIPLCLPKSPSLPVVLLAVLLSGSGYLNLETSWPSARKETVTRDLHRDGQASGMWSGVAVVSSDEMETWNALKGSEDFPSLQLVDPDAIIGPWLNNLQSLPPVPTVALPTPPPSAPAYLIFTSGSTGTPKGIVVEHRNVASFLKSYHGVFGRQPGERVLGSVGYGFDVFVVSFWDTLAHGATHVILPPSQLASLPEAILRLNITLVDLTPTISTLVFEYADAQPKEGESVKEAWTRAGFGKLKQVNTGGERVEGWIRDRWFERGVKVVIDYGPSETTVGVIANQNPHSTPIPIGRPTGLNHIHILSPTSPTPVPLGCIGEICVSGPQISRGYLKAELNDGVFIAVDGMGRVYRTGDWGRWLADGEGNVEFCGRRDGMVKVNGLRIEIGEIEHILDQKAHPALQRGVVDRLEKDGTAPGLVAFLLLSPSSDLLKNVEIPQTDGSGPFVLPIVDHEDFLSMVETLKSQVAKSLPAYMVPRYWLPVSHFPTQGMGKTDRKSLSRLAHSHDFRRRRSAKQSAVLDDEHLAAVKEVWGTVLRLDPSDIADHDEFAKLGGDSIGFLKVITLLRGREYQLSFRSLEDAESVAKCADVLRSSATTPAGTTNGTSTAPYLPFSLVGADTHRQKLLDGLKETLQLDEVEDLLPTAPSQDSILAASVDSSHYFAQAVYDVLDDNLSSETLASSLKELVKLHPLLRTCFAILKDESSVLQVVLSTDSRQVQKCSELAVVECEEVDFQERVKSFVGEERTRHTFEWGVLSLAFTLFVSSDGKRKLLWSMHHAMSDGWTLELLITDLRALCQQLPLASRPPFASIVSSWHPPQPIPEPTADFWRSYMDKAQPMNWPSTSAVQGELLCTSTSAEVWWRGSLAKLARNHGITPAIASRVAIGVALAQHAGHDDVVIGIVRSGRDVDVVNADEVVGPCVSVLPGRFQISASNPPSLLHLAQQELATDRQIRSHQHVTLAQLSKLCRLTSRSDMFNILLTYQSLAERGEEEERRAPWPIRQPPAFISMPTNYALSFEITPSPRNDALELSCFYDARVVSAEDVEAVLRTASKILDQLVDAPSATANSCAPRPRCAGATAAPSKMNGATKEASQSDIDSVVEKVLPLWASVLRMDVNDVGKEDTFASLGGDSIGVMRLSAALKQAGYPIPLGVLANLGTVLAQATWLASH